MESLVVLGREGTGFWRREDLQGRQRSPVARKGAMLSF